MNATNALNGEPRAGARRWLRRKMSGKRPLELDDAATASVDTGAGDEPVAAAGMSGNGEGAAKGGTDTEVLDKEGGGESLEGAVAALAEDAEGDGNEETQL